MTDAWTISLDTARTALDAALADAQAAELNVAVAVVDRGGRLRCFASTDGVFALAGQIAQDKAYTVIVGGGAPTTILEKMVGSDVIIERLLHVDARVMAVGGGVPILVNGALVGAIGVSGAPTADRDDEIARKGADAVASAPA